LARQPSNFALDTIHILCVYLTSQYIVSLSPPWEAPHRRIETTMPLVKSPTLTPARLAANRLNALKSTGPRTAAGKRRSALNALSRDLCPQELDRQLRARGEDPREFRRLHRDLIAIFQPRDEPAGRAVELLARTWWEKARRIRQWVAAGPARSEDLEARLEELLRLVVHVQRQRHEWWHHRLVSVLGRPLGPPAEVRRRIESRLSIFGARPGRREYPRESRRERLLAELQEARILAGEAPRPAPRA
jgi:hypothetical protein